MENKNKLNIDHWLKTKIETHTPTESGNFSDFLSKLENFNNNYVSIDEVVEKKLSNAKQYTDYNWKNIIYLIWFRRLKNSLYVLIPVMTFYLGINYYFNTEFNYLGKVFNKTNIENSLVNDKNTIENENNIKTISNNLNEINLTKNQLKTFDKNKSFSKNNKSKTIVNSNKIDLNLNEFDVDLEIKFSGKQINKLYSNSNVDLAYSKPKFKSQFKPKQIPWILDFNHNQVMFNVFLTNNFHSFNTSVNNNLKQINKYYEAFVNDGRRTGNTFNLGFQVDKQILRNVSMSLGFQTNNMNHLQHSNFEITEVPVIDLDGTINPQYLKIIPERLELTNNFRIKAYVIPLKLLYHLTLNKNYFANLYLGGSFTQFKLLNFGNIDQKDLFSLSKEKELKYSNFKNVEYGFDINKSLKKNFYVSLGLSSQQYFDLKTSINKNEKTKAYNYQIKLTLKYNLQYGKK